MTVEGLLSRTSPSGNCSRPGDVWNRDDIGAAGQNTDTGQSCDHLCGTHWPDGPELSLTSADGTPDLLTVELNVYEAIFNYENKSNTYETAMKIRFLYSEELNFGGKLTNAFQ